MDNIKKAIDKLKDLLKSKKGPNIEGCISKLTSTVALLESLLPSVDQVKNISGFLREDIQPLYSAHLQATLNYAIAVLKFLHYEKIVPFLRSGDPGRANLWEGPASSVVSGILDYLEQHRTKKARETIASVVNPIICALYFTNGPDFLSSYDGNMLSNVYMLLGETLVSPGAEVGNLRDEHIGSRRLGRTIAEIRNYLALESIIILLGNLIPPLKSGREKRTKFLQEVFDESVFKDNRRILQALEVIQRDWTVTATKIIHLLAGSDSRFPQPFSISRFQVESSSMTTSDPIFVDNKSFVASLDQGGSVDSLVIQFTTVRGIAISALNGSEMKVELLVNKAPLLGTNPMPLPQQEIYSVTFSISKASVDNFGKIIRERNLRMDRPALRKLSQAPGELLPEIVTKEDEKNWREKAAKLTNMAKHRDAGPVDQDKCSTSSPRVEQSTSSDLADHQDRSASVGAPDTIPSAVFLDPDGNFSIFPPRPTDFDHEKTVNTSDNFLSRKDQREPSEADEIVSQPKRRSKTKTQTIVISDDEDADEPLPNPEVGTLKQKMGKTEKRPDSTQSLKASKIDGNSLQNKKLATGIENGKSRTKDSKDSKKSNETKKRPLQEDDADVEAPTAKRARQELDSILPPSVAIPEQRPTRYDRKSRRLLPASANDGSGLDLDVDFDEVPKSKQTRPQARAKAMKGKDGKVAPRPRPVIRKKNKKQNEPIETEQRKANLEAEDADKTLVEQAEQLKSHQIKTEIGRSNKGPNLQTANANKNETTRSKKSNKAPWEVQDLVSVKIEMNEEISVGFDSIDELPSKIEQPSSDVVKTERQDLPLHKYGGRYVEFMEPVKSETSSSEPPPSPPAVAQSTQVWIDLTNSPESAQMTKPKTLKHNVRKAPSFDARHEELGVSSVRRDQKLYRTGIDKAHRTVEKVPLLPVPSDAPESVLSSPSSTRDGRSTKTKKVSSHIRAHRVPLNSGMLDFAQETTRATGRHLVEEEARTRATAKEQNSGLSHSRRPRGSEVEDDPDLRIAAVLGEINQVLVRNIQKRFTGMSNDLRHMKRELKAQVAGELGKMNNELFKRYNGLVELHEDYVSRTTRLTNALEVFEKATADSVQSYRDMLKDFRHNSLRNKLPMDLVKETTLAEIKKHSKLKIEI